MFKLYFQLPGECRNRYYKEVLPQLSRTLVDVLGDRATKCYYLVYVGTKPNARGKGYAKKLIRHMIAKVETRNFPLLPFELLANCSRLTQIIAPCISNQAPWPITPTTSALASRSGRQLNSAVDGRLSSSTLWSVSPSPGGKLTRHQGCVGSEVSRFSGVLGRSARL